jgi:small basic protein
VPAADGGLLAGLQSHVKASVFITRFSFAVYVAARITGAPRGLGGHAIPGGPRTGWYVRQDG